MANENVKTENSTEFQEYKNAVLNGITWTKRTDPETEHELHMGQVGNYQIYLSESPNFRDCDENRSLYTLSLWEMGVKTTMSPANPTVAGSDNLVIVRPTFTQLITNAVIEAFGDDEAKLAAVQYIMNWNQTRLEAAQTEFDKVNGVFDALDDVLSKKVIATKASDSVKTLAISGAAVNALFANNIHVIGELAALTVKDIKAIKGLGGNRGQEVLFALKKLGIIIPKE